MTGTESQPSFVMEFDFNNTSDSIYDFNLDIGNNVNVNNATLAFLNASDLSTFTGDILLFDSPNDTSGSQFANALEGQTFGAYQITYVFSGTPMGDEGFGNGTGSSIALVRAVPEPGTLAFFGICALGLATRRRRS